MKYCARVTASTGSARRPKSPRVLVWEHFLVLVQRFQLLRIQANPQLQSLHSLAEILLSSLRVGTHTYQPKHGCRTASIISLNTNKSRPTRVSVSHSVSTSTTEPTTCHRLPISHTAAYSYSNYSLQPDSISHVACNSLCPTKSDSSSSENITTEPTPMCSSLTALHSQRPATHLVLGHSQSCLQTH